MLQLNNKIYYLRYIVPVDVYYIFQRKEILKSLKTTNKHEAILLHNIGIANLNKITFYIRIKLMTQNKFDEIIENFKKNKIEEINTFYIEHPNPKQEQIHSEWLYDDMITNFKTMIQENDYSVINNEIDELLQKSNIINIDNKQRNKFSKSICLSYCGTLEYMSKLFSGDIVLNDKYNIAHYINKPLLNTIETITNIQEQANQVALSGITMDQAFDDFILYKKNKKEVSESSIKDYKSAKKYLVRFCNINKDVALFTKKDFLDLQDLFQVLPVHLFNGKKYDLFTVEQLENIDAPKLKNQTINAKFVIYKSVFQYLLKFTDSISKNVVVCEPLKEVETKKDRYTDEDLKVIFKSSIDNVIKEMLLISIYTGSRIGEICMLTKKDIIQIDGYSIIDIKDGKTINAQRQIPIHSKIKKLINTKCTNVISNDTYLFYKDYTPKSDELDDSFDIQKKRIKYITDKVNKQLNKIIISNNKTFHSGRKSFVSKLYETSPDKESLIKLLTGHSTKDNITLNIYATISMKQKYEMIELISYDEIIF